MICLQRRLSLGPSHFELTACSFTPLSEPSIRVAAAPLIPFAAFAGWAQLIRYGPPRPLTPLAAALDAAAGAGESASRRACPPAG